MCCAVISWLQRIFCHFFCRCKMHSTGICSDCFCHSRASSRRFATKSSAMQTYFRPLPIPCTALHHRSSGIPFSSSQIYGAPSIAPVLKIDSALRPAARFLYTAQVLSFTSALSPSFSLNSRKSYTLNNWLKRFNDKNFMSLSAETGSETFHGKNSASR